MGLEKKEKKYIFFSFFPTNFINLFPGCENFFFIKMRDWYSTFGNYYLEIEKEGIECKFLDINFFVLVELERKKKFFFIIFFHETKTRV